MKKLTSLLLCISTCLALFTSCANGNTQTTEGTLSEQTTQTTEDTCTESGITELPLSEIYIPEDFPNFADESIKTVSFGHSWTFFNVFRIAEIRDNAVYLAPMNATAVRCVILGIPNEEISVGDYVEVSVSRYFVLKNSYKYEAVYAEDISSFKVLTWEEAKEKYSQQMKLDKPVIYLYPEEETVCSVKVLLDGELTCTYPEHGVEGWQCFTAHPDGTLIFPDESEYYCLYWEGKASIDFDFSKGFCISGGSTAEFLAAILPQIGLTAREANEFIIYWLPQLMGNEYNLISFQTEAYTSAAELEISPDPDSVLRVFMAVNPLDGYVDIEPQEFSGFERNGFTVVEWGGSIVE